VTVLDRARHWDAIVSHWLLPCGLAGALAARGRPHVAIAHAGDVHLAERLPLGRLVARALARSPTRLVFVTEALRARFAELSGQSPIGEVVAMGVEEPGVAEPPADRPSEGPLRVLFLGRLVPIKGADVLVAAAAQLPDVEVGIAGAGPAEAELRARAPANVRWLGLLGGADKWRALAEADVLCVPSRRLADGRSEGSPVVIAEAQRMGRPAVGSATGGVPEAVGGAGLLVPPDDPAALALALARLRDDRSLLAQLAAQARARGALRGWSQVGPRIVGSLGNLLQP
jgi:glycosyltransferase involved in cell wall biosynthesis